MTKENKAYDRRKLVIPGHVNNNNISYVTIKDKIISELEITRVCN